MKTTPRLNPNEKEERKREEGEEATGAEWPSIPRFSMPSNRTEGWMIVNVLQAHSKDLDQHYEAPLYWGDWFKFELWKYTHDPGLDRKSVV